MATPQKPPSVQDTLLNQLLAAKLPVQVYLMNGIRLAGLMHSHDQYVITITSNGAQQMVYKHAISSISLATNEARVPRLNSVEHRASGKRTISLPITSEI